VTEKGVPEKLVGRPMKWGSPVVKGNCLIHRSWKGALEIIMVIRMSLSSHGDDWKMLKAGLVRAGCSRSCPIGF